MDGWENRRKNFVFLDLPNDTYIPRSSVPNDDDYDDNEDDHHYDSDVSDDDGDDDEDDNNNDVLSRDAITTSNPPKVSL